MPLADDIIAAISSSLLVLDQQFRVVFANDHFYRTFQISPQQTQGQSIDRLLILPGMEKPIRELRLSGKPFTHLECTIGPESSQANSNRTLSVSSSVLAPTEPDCPQRFLLVISDITQLKYSEQQLMRQADSAKQSSRLKTEFLANMSHEIRTPMNGIIGFADLLAMEELSEPQTEWVNVIRSCGHNLLRLIDDILDISKIEANKLRIEPCQFGISDVLSDLQRTTASVIESQGLSFSIERDPDTPATMTSDPQRLGQILTNLLTNARKFTPTGGITLRAAADTLDNTPAVRFEVIDTGIGIAAEYHQTIFDVFRQVDSSASRKYGSSGLGLAICKRLTHRLGGKIWVESLPGEGSTFVLVLPLQIPLSDSTALPASLLDQNADSTQHSGILQLSGRILLAEDNRITRNLLTIILERVGLQVDQAEDGRKAVELATGRAYDLILMDIQMPSMDGLEATRILRQQGLTTPIIALTAHVMVHEQEQFTQAGFDGVLPKPVNQGTLLATVQEHLSAPVPATAAS